MDKNNNLTARQILAVILSGYNARVETVTAGKVFHVHTSPGQLEAVEMIELAGELENEVHRLRAAQPTRQQIADAIYHSHEPLQGIAYLSERAADAVLNLYGSQPADWCVDEACEPLCRHRATPRAPAGAPSPDPEPDELDIKIQRAEIYQRGWEAGYAVALAAVDPGEAP